MPLVIIPLFEFSSQVKIILVTSSIIFGQVTYTIGLILGGAHLFEVLKRKKISWHSLRSGISSKFKKTKSK